MFYTKFPLYQENNLTGAIDKTLERELNLAKNIQTKLLNGKTPEFKGGQVSGVSIPARLIGGDYYDFYKLKNGKIRIIIGDVMGKGIPAAMLMILTRGAFRSAAENTEGPGETLISMNRALYDDLRTLRSFVTVFCAEWDPVSRILTYANSGHILPLHINSSEIQEIPRAKGVMLGGLPNQVYKEHSLQLDDGDIIFMYTDGIIEAQDEEGNQFSRERLIRILQKNRDVDVEVMEEKVSDSVSKFTEGIPQKDDITMVILKIEEDNVCSNLDES